MRLDNTASARLNIGFRNKVPSVHRAMVENLFFFHPKQADRLKQIRKAVELYGTPTIQESGDGITLGVDSQAMQCLFACDDREDTMRIAGVVLYLRPRLDRIVIAHLAVDESYKSCVDEEGISVCVKLIHQVSAIAHRIKGVRMIELPYQTGHFLPV